MYIHTYVYCLHTHIYIYIYGSPPPPGPTSAMKRILSALVLLRINIENPVNTDKFGVGSYGLKLI